MEKDPLSLAGRPDASTLLATELPERPVWQAEPGVIHVVGYDACREVLLDHERFSADASRYGPTGLGGAAAPPRTMNASDPPVHTQLRGLVVDTFTRSAVAARVPALTALATALVEPIVAEGCFDPVADLAEPYVQGSLTAVLGLPRSEGLDLRAWTAALSTPTGRAEVERARRELTEHFGELLDHPHALDDGVLRTLASHLETGVLRREQALATCVLLLQAGGDTSRNLIAGALVTLAELPETYAHLRDGVAARHEFVEEALRFHAPVAAAVRYTSAATTLAGVTVDGRCPVFAWLGAANRDPGVYEDAGDFAPSRRAQHLALGAGVHRCLGSHLARRQIAVLLAVVSDHIAALELDGPVTWLPSPLARGVRHARIRCETTHDSQRTRSGVIADG